MNSLLPIRMIAMDMDGTLLDPNGMITPFSVDTLRLAQLRGVLVVICSGRFPENAGMVVREAGLNCPIIGLNGCILTDAPLGRILSHHPMDSGAAHRVYDRLEECGADYYVFCMRHLATRRTGAMHHSEVRFGEKMQTEACCTFTSGKEAVQSALEREVYKFFVYDKQQTAKLSAIREALAPLEGISITQSGDTNLEVIPSGVDKGTGLLEMAAIHGIPPEQIMAFGDHINDLPMLSAAGWGFAMSNATPRVLAAAGYITLGNDRDGVADAVRRFVLA